MQSVRSGAACAAASWTGSSSAASIRSRRTSWISTAMQARLVIELDGSQHTIEGDAARTRFLESRGLKILRFGSNDALNQTDAVIEAIWNATSAARPSPQPLSRRERGSKQTERYDDLKQRLPIRLRQRVRQRGGAPARCRRGATRRSGSRTACTPSSCRARRSPRRATRTAAAGCTASARRPCTARSRRTRSRASTTTSATARCRPTSCAGIRCRCRSSRSISSTACSPWPATVRRRRSTASASICMPPTATCRAATSTTPTASC